MKKTLRKQSVLHFLPWMITSAVIAMILIVLSAQGMYFRIAGPNAINDRFPTDGEYVQFDASKIIVAVASLSSKSENESSTLKTYYLLPVSDTQYMAVVDRKEKNADVLKQAMDQSHEYYLGDLAELKQLGNICGTVVPLESDMADYMITAIQNYDLPGNSEEVDTSSLIYPYQIDLSRTGFLPTQISLYLFIAGLVMLCVFLAILVPVLSGAYQKKAFTEAVSQNEIQELEADFLSTRQIEKQFIGKYLWYTNGAKTGFVQTSSIVWGYIMPEPLVISKYRWPVAIYNMEQKLIKVFFKEKKNAQEFLAEIENQNAIFVSGYSAKTADLFKNDFESFLKYASKKEE